MVCATTNGANGVIPVIPDGPSLVFPFSDRLYQTPLAFLHMIERLKTTRRTGWINRNLHNRESIADHMYRMSILCMLCPELSINRDKCVKMALVHDMAEAIVGDITPLDQIPKSEKHRRELEAMHYMMDTLLRPSCPNAANEMMELWEEYEAAQTDDAKFVKDVDKFELLMQVVEYEYDQQGTREFSEFLDTMKTINTVCIREWFEAAVEERQKIWKSFKAINGN